MTPRRITGHIAAAAAAVLAVSALPGAGVADDKPPAAQMKAPPQGTFEYAHGVKALKLKLYPRAIAHLTVAIRSGDLDSKQLSDAHYFRGRALVRSERPEAALEDFTRAVTFWPENVKALRLRCRSLALAKQPDAARKDCDLAVSLDGTDWKNWFTRGLLSKEQGDDPAAKIDLALAMARMPDGMTTFPFVYRPLRDLGLLQSSPPPPASESTRAGD
ncbi:MAG: tetratricopeptide repeat protein [Rhodospirillaceae bacterium]